MFFPASQVITWVTQYQYLFLFPAAVLEGPIVTIIAGFLSSLGYINFLLAYAVIVIGDLTGDSIYYALGYWGEKKFVTKFSHYIGVTSERLDKLKNHFKNHTRKTIFLGKLAHGIGSAILVAAGMAKISFREFLFYNFISTIPKSLILLLAGFYFGEAYGRIERYFDYSAIIMVATSISFMAIYYFVKVIAGRFSKD